VASAGTALSLKNLLYFQSIGIGCIGKPGVGVMSTCTCFTLFSEDSALEYAQEYLLTPPKTLEAKILAGRPRFAAQVVQDMLQSEHKSWEEALADLRTFRMESLQWSLHEKKKSLPDVQVGQLRESLQLLLRDSESVRRGAKEGYGVNSYELRASVDFIELGICHVVRLSEYTCKMALPEPLVAMAVSSFLTAIDE
jgi:hypothetical protein